MTRILWTEWEWWMKLMWPASFRVLLDVLQTTSHSRSSLNVYYNMETLVDKLLILFTLFGGWKFRSSGKKRLDESPESHSEPNTPSLPVRTNECARKSEGLQSSASQPIAIKGKRPATSETGRSSSQSLPKSYKSTWESSTSSTPRSLSSSQYSSMHQQVWEQAFRNGCRWWTIRRKWQIE